MRRSWLILSLLLAMVFAYHNPWMLHKTAVFTWNAFDLAEGASLHPDIRAESPTLLTPLYLRLPLVMIGVMIAIIAAQLRDERWRWIWRGIAILVVLRLNPPIDFYPFGNEDANYNQLGYLMFSGLGLIGLVTVGSHWIKGISIPLLIIALGLTLYSSIIGYRTAIDTFQRVGLDVDIGGGLVMFVSLALCVGALAVLPPLVQYIQKARKLPAS
ncbi:MAG: hypothetical protein CUN55_04900 [Phototrophicales bacterium]|nr:MAG: hypothetical protein CUN55_04900 [Phototrophicales bacterium]